MLVRAACLWMIIFVLASCKTSQLHEGVNTIKFSENSAHPIIKREPGIKVYNASLVEYKRPSQNNLNVFFDKPLVVDIAPKAYGWGYYQFPVIGYKKDGSMAVSWEMKEDRSEDYGKQSKFSWASKNKGKTWSYIQHDVEGFGGLKTPSGDFIKLSLPNNISEKDLKLSPPKTFGIMAYVQKPVPLYKIDDLPQNRQGVFIERQKKNSNVWLNEQSKLIDTGGHRYTYNGFMPVVWLGDMRVDKNKKIYTCIYRDYRNGAGSTKEGYLKEGMGCFSSDDNGYTWVFEGASFYTADDKTVDPIAEKRAGWSPVWKF